MTSKPQAKRMIAASPIERTVALLPINFFILAVFSFAVGVAAMPLIVRRVVVDYFYGPWQLALVHTFALGWVTASIMGVMYRYVPALTRRALPFPRLAVAQFVLFFIGASGMVSHFAIGIWFGLWLTAMVMVMSVVLFAVNLMPLLWRHITSGVAEAGMFGAICFLLAAAILGLLLAMDKTYNFMGGSLLTNLGAHAALAAIGWVTLAVCAVSYRMLPAFILPKISLPRTIVWQVYALMAGVVALATTLLAGLPGVVLWTAVVVLSLLVYLATMVRLTIAKRIALDWTTRHALAGFVWMVAAIAAGSALAWAGAGSFEGGRIAAAFGAAGLLGFFSNFIIGMSYHLFPGFVVRARNAARWTAVRSDSLADPRPRLAIFVLFNSGVAVLTGGLLSGSVWAAQAGAVIIAIGGLTYVTAMLWTLSFAYRNSVPAQPRSRAINAAPADG
jgi:hypothetical protein